jgi:hypothetical protein
VGARGFTDVNDADSVDGGTRDSATDVEPGRAEGESAVSLRWLRVDGGWVGADAESGVAESGAGGGDGSEARTDPVVVAWVDGDVRDGRRWSV